MRTWLNILYRLIVKFIVLRFDYITDKIIAQGCKGPIPEGLLVKKDD